MRFRDLLKTSLSGLRRSKTRSFLTMLGIIIGISSVILLMSIGNSAQDLILSQVENIGSNLIFIVPGATKGSRFSPPPSVLGVVIKTLNKTDADALRREPSIKNVSATVHGQARIVYGNNDTAVTLDGTNAEFFQIINFKLARGSFFTKEDEDSMNRVVVLGSEIAKTLFGDLDPVGKNVRLKDLSFRVAGVLEKKGRGALGADLDNFVGMPLGVLQKQITGTDYYQTLTVQASDAYDIEFTKSRIVSILRQDHHITDPSKDDFTIRTQEDALNLLGNITSIMTLFLTSIALISLVVGGIGIMNIMLVSVVERTKEIGLRKAIGATNKDILRQFLLEAAMLTLFGGIAGIAFGALVDAILYLILSRVLSTGWVFSLPLSAIGLAVGVSALTGIAFGIYPARQAARKNPVDSLRYE